MLDFGIKHNNNIKLSSGLMTTQNFDLLFHGPCEPLFTINPSEIYKLTGISTLNIAQRHTDFADNFLQLYLYLKNNSEVKSIWLYVTPESFDKRFNTFHTYRYAPYLNDSTVASVVATVDPNYSRWTWIPMMKYAYYNRYKNWEAIQGVFHALKHDTIPYYQDGYLPHEETYFTSGDLGYVEPQQFVFNNFVPSSEVDNHLFYELYEDDEVFVWDDDRAIYLQKIIDLCKQNSIHLVLYESPAYYESIKDQKNRGAFLNKINAIAKNNQIKFIQFQDSSIDKEQKNFVCPLILSPQGTNKFMPVLSDSIKKYMISY